jgi:hypothetical protein
MPKDNNRYTNNYSSKNNNGDITKPADNKNNPINETDKRITNAQTEGKNKDRLARPRKQIKTQTLPQTINKTKPDSHTKHQKINIRHPLSHAKPIKPPAISNRSQTQPHSPTDRAQLQPAAKTNPPIRTLVKQEEDLRLARRQTIHKTSTLKILQINVQSLRSNYL